MHAAFSTIRMFASPACPARALCIALSAVCISAQAHQHGEPLDHVVQGLPELPGLADTVPGYFELEEDSAELGYVSRFKKWRAKFDQYLGLNPNVKLDYGLQLTNKLGAGGTFTRQDAFSEVVLNGVYAPQKNVRLRVTGAQLRNVDGFSLFANGDGNPVLQNSYLLNARKYWSKYRYLSDLGLTAYSTEANASPALTEMTEGESSPSRVGRKDGYMINLGLRPTSQSRIELRREFSHLSYYLGEDARYATQSISSGIKYSHYLDNCVRLQGRVSTSTDSGRLDLNIARNNWSINLSREQNGEDANLAILFGYTVPLGTRPSHGSTCNNTTQKVPAFEPIVDASVTRPVQLPSEPLLMEMP